MKTVAEVFLKPLAYSLCSISGFMAGFFGTSYLKFAIPLFITGIVLIFVIAKIENKK
jgi:hypothetical protein